MHIRVLHIVIITAYHIVTTCKLKKIKVIAENYDLLSDCNLLVLH